MKTVNGEASFEDLKMTDSGYYQITIESSDGLASATTQQFSVTKLESFSYTVSDTSLSMNFFFSLKI